MANNKKSAIREFLSSRGCDTTGWSDVDCRKVATGLGFPSVRLESYTPKSGNKGEGMYLIASIHGGRDSFFRLCDGKELTSEGRDAAKALAATIVQVVS